MPKMKVNNVKSAKIKFKSGKVRTSWGRAEPSSGKPKLAAIDLK